MDIDIFQLPGIVLRRVHYVILSALACAALAGGYVMLQQPVYRSTAEVMVDIPRGPVVGTDMSGNSDTQLPLVGSQLFLLQSREVLRDVVRRLDLEKDPYLSGGEGGEGAADRVVDAIAENLLVTRNGESFVFSISMKHRDSAMAAKIANGIAESYLRISSTARFDVNLRTSRTIEEQTGELRQRVLDAQAAVETFRAENGLLTTGEQGLITDQQLAALNQQLLSARQQAEQQKTAAEQARRLNLSDVESGAIPEALQSTSLTALRGRYAQALDRQAELSANLGNGHPQMKAVRSQVASMRMAIEKELVRIRQTAQNTYERAQANLASVQKGFDEAATGDNGKVRFRLAQLVSEAEAIDTVYKAFLTRAEELSRQQDLGNNNSRVISAAVPSTKPIQAPKLLVLIAALLFGTMLGAVLAVARELLNGTVRSQRDLVTRTGVPVIAVIEDGNAGRDGGWGEKLARVVVPFARETASPAAGPRVSGLQRAAHLLDAQFGSDGPVTIAVLSAGNAGHGHAALGIARELQGLGRNVLFSDGGLRAAAASSVKIRTDLSRRNPVQTLEDMLQFRHLETGLRRVSALSSARVSTVFRDAVSDFTIIDCCGTPAEAILPAILRRVDGILVVSAIGATGSEALTTLVAEIDPWRDRLVGNIVVGDRAA